MKVKVIEFIGDSKLFEDKINDFITSKPIEVIDIKFEVNNYGASKLYLALIMYKNID